MDLRTFIFHMQSSYGWDHRVHPTNIASPADLVISLLSPILSPWILYDPVRLILKSDRSISCSPIAHQKHSMIQHMLWADVWARNSSYVCLHENSIDANCKMEKNPLLPPLVGFNNKPGKYFQKRIGEANYLRGDHSSPNLRQSGLHQGTQRWS